MLRPGFAGGGGHRHGRGTPRQRWFVHAETSALEALMRGARSARHASCLSVPDCPLFQEMHRMIALDSRTGDSNSDHDLVINLKTAKALGLAVSLYELLPVDVGTPPT